MTAYRFVQDHRAGFETKRLCDLVGVPRSSVYTWVNHRPSARALADQELLVEIREIYAAGSLAPGSLA